MNEYLIVEKYGSGNLNFLFSQAVGLGLGRYKISAKPYYQQCSLSGIRIGNNSLDKGKLIGMRGNRI